MKVTIKDGQANVATEFRRDMMDIQHKPLNRRRTLMISKIISRAACLRELASNPKSFSNCPDLHGGVPDLAEDRICMKNPLNKTKGVPLAIAVAGV